MKSIIDESLEMKLKLTFFFVFYVVMDLSLQHEYA